jgi:hypothetical protein
MPTERRSRRRKSGAKKEKSIVEKIHTMSITSIISIVEVRL